MCPLIPTIDSSDEDAGYGTEPSPSAVELKGNNNGISSTLEFNLGPYIDSYKAGDNAAYLLKREAFEEIVSGLMGGTLWEKVLQAALDKAIENGELTISERTVIENSPACEWMARACLQFTVIH